MTLINNNIFFIRNSFNGLPVRVLYQITVQIAFMLRNGPQIMLGSVKLAILYSYITIIGAYIVTGLEAMRIAIHYLFGYFPTHDVLVAQAFKGQLCTSFVANGLNKLGFTLR